MTTSRLLFINGHGLDDRVEILERGSLFEIKRFRFGKRLRVNDVTPLQASHLMLFLEGEGFRPVKLGRGA